MLFSLRKFPLAGKTVLLRVDYNVPLKEGKVLDAKRIVASIPTLQFLLHQNCKIILATHLSQPEGKFVPEFSTKNLVSTLQGLFPKRKIVWLNDCIGKEVRKKISAGSTKEIFLLENLRFYSQEEENNAFFAHSLASLAQVYVNDAFAVSHRKHASVQAITQYLPSIPGFLLEKEIAQLQKALHPQKPVVWIIGGAKLNKIGLLQQALKKADFILIGGALAFAFLKAKGIPIGMSKIDTSSVREAKKILQSSLSKKIILPIDFLVAEQFSPRAKARVVSANAIQSQQMGLDLGPRSVEHFKSYLQKAKTIVWNGPLGYFEWEKFAFSTKAIGRFIGTLSATSLAGGGETAEALEKFRLTHCFTHLSTGGGAALEFLSGKELPAIKALENNYKHWRNRIKT